MSERDEHSGHRLFDVTLQQLRRTSVLSTLGDQELSELSRLCDGLLCMPDQCLVSPTDDTRSVYFILEGRVRIANDSASDREVLFREMAAGDMFGELAAISGAPRSAGVWTIEETRVARLSTASFWQLITTDTVVMRAILQHLVELVYALTKRVIEHDSLKVESRIHAELLRMGRERGIENNQAVIDPAPTQEDIGKLVGTNRHTANKELRKLEKASVIEISRQRITLRDVGGLENLIESGQHAGRYAAGESHNVDAPPRSSLPRGRHRSPGRSMSGESGYVRDAMELWDQALHDRECQD